MIKIEKIELNNFRFFIDEEQNNTFYPNKNGMLIYGENGSGKSSIYKAFEFLAKPTIDEFEFNENINIFKNKDTYLKFDFSNNQTLKIDKNNFKKDIDFINNFSLINPILDYKKLLQINFMKEQGYKKINIYHLLNKIFEYYPVKDGKKLLKDIENPNNQLNELKNIIDILLDDINLFLEKFNTEFKVEKFIYSTDYIPLAKGLGLNNALEFIVNIEINFKNKIIEKHHEFLNEAKLSSLAMAIYFAIIRHLSNLNLNNSLKILVLDDLLISLDMNNRLNLIKILQEEFSDFQIFFFTHDKGLFDIVNEKMNLKPYEIYVTKKDEFEVPFIKQSNSLLAQAIQQKDSYNYGCSANLLRQALEEILCKFLPKEFLLDSKCRRILDLDKILNQSIKFEKNNQNIIDNFKKLKTFKRVLLNDASHYNNTNMYKDELKEVISILTELKTKIIET